MCPNSYFQYYLFGDDMVAHTDPNYTRADQVVDTREKRVFGECAHIAKSRVPQRIQHYKSVSMLNLLWI